LIAEGTTCSALDEPLVLAVALLVDADLGREPEPEPAPEPLPPEPPEPPEPERSTHEAEPRALPPEPPQPWRLSTDLSVLGADGVLPELALGAELALLADPPWLFPIRVRGVGFLPQHVALEPAGSIDLALGLVG